MGVGKDPAQKANSDYKNRTEDSLGIDKASTTFVFVTPRRWPKKTDWAARKRAEGHWRNVWALDADDIEQALDEAPAVHFWLSEVLGMPAAEVQTLEDWWERFSSVYKPALTPRMILAGRADEAAVLLRLLARDAGRTLIRAASVDDGLAFVGCVMLSADPDTSAALLSKSLLVHDGASLRRLDSTSSLLILLPYEEHLRREADLVRNHHVVCIVTDNGDVDLDLPPLGDLALQAELRTAGVPESDLARYIWAAHKSLVALRRVANKNGGSQPDNWVGELEDRVVRRAWLAGSWNAQRSGDIQVLSALVGEGWASVEARLRDIARQPDPLFSFVGSAWAVASQIDSWPTARLTITSADLSALELSIQTVLSAVDPRLDLPAKDRWTAAIHGKVRVHSTDLRRGMARSIALLGARGDELRLVGGRTARLWAEAITAQLLARANDDKSASLLASLDDVMPLLAETAPDVFLRAVARGTEGPHPLLLQLFQDGKDDFAVGSPHTGLLWALETVAWSPMYLGFAAEVLAVLAEMDPGGRLSNRPATSLVGIFRPWRPQTAASAETRLLTLDALLDRHRDVTWDLLVALLPRPSDIATETHKPEFRDWAVDLPTTVTRQDYLSFADAVGERLTAIAASAPERWVSVVTAFDRLVPRTQTETLRALAVLDSSLLPADTRTSLWTAIESVVRRHREYAGVEWSLTEDALASLELVGQRFQPSSPSAIHRWLFDERQPTLGTPNLDYQQYEMQLAGVRMAAAREILDREGFSALVDLANDVELPGAIGASLAEVSEQDADTDIVQLLDSPSAKLQQFANAFARARAATDRTWVERWIGRASGSPKIQARLLQAVSDPLAAWQMADALGGEVPKIYWNEFLPYGRGGNFAEAAEAARRLLKYGRAAMAVETLSMYAERLRGEIDVEVVVEALRAFASAHDPGIARVSEYDLTRLLDFLRAHGVSDEEVATLEWKFLPILGHDGRTLSLQRLLARDPATFAAFVNMVFRPAKAKGEPEERPSEQTAETASNAYRVLREWRIVPGTNDEGAVDAAPLQKWLSQARRLLRDADRADIGELQIGEVLAHAPADPDGTFPTPAIRDVLENAPNDRLGRGFVVGLYNKRGVTRRGMTEGGQQEHELARQYDNWAGRIEATHPRTAGILRSVAESYREEGRRNDEEVRRFLEGLTWKDDLVQVSVRDDASTIRDVLAVLVERGGQNVQAMYDGLIGMGYVPGVAAPRPDGTRELYLGWSDPARLDKGRTRFALYLEARMVSFRRATDRRKVAGLLGADNTPSSYVAFRLNGPDGVSHALAAARAIKR